MLIRIVRMTFKPENVEDFLTLFKESQDQIRNFKGCLHLELLRDFHQSNTYYTHSYWTDDAALEGYRKSILFKKIWKNTKVLFKEKPMAFSLFRGHDEAPS